MPNTTPSWDDLLDATPLNLANLIERARAAIAGLPLLTDADKEAANARVRETLSAAFSLENLTAAFAGVPAAVYSFVTSGEGPVEKSPTDLM